MNIRIGFSDKFFEALTLLQPNIQAKVNQLVLKFQSNPESPGLNYEKISNTKDQSMRSIRAGNDYRVILAAPEQGNIYLFLWVDQHDQAYAWANRHQCRVNPNTGSIQLYATESVVSEQSIPDEDVKKSLFDGLKDRQLLKLGVPEEQIEIVRGVSSEPELDNIQSLLPQEAYEGLFYYMAGESYDDILREREVKEEEQFDKEDFSSALGRIQSKYGFVVPESEVELTEMLNAPMDKWRVFLHPTQRRLAEGTKNGAFRVLGGAGTGKTVVAMHRAKWLARNYDRDKKKILFTTFTRNLAIDIKRNLESICSQEEMARIEIVNLDKWVQRFLRKHSYDFEVAYDENALRQHWERALSAKPASENFPDNFYQEEWSRVIQPQGIKTLSDYKKASRIGRGTRLNRQQRVNIWPVFEEYRHRLNRARLKEVDDAYQDAAALISIQNLELSYSAVVVDEAQDMGTQAFKLIRALVPEGTDDLFIVGDAHQRIYGRNRVVLGRCDINIRGRSRKLTINYRTTEEIRSFATGILEGRHIDDLDGGEDTNTLYKSLTHGQAPILEHFETAKDQAAYIEKLLANPEVSPASTCVVARTNKEILAIQELLELHGLKTSIIQPNKPEEEDSDSLKLATVHRVKGLEFDLVILASANQGLIPLNTVITNKADAVSEEDADTEERSLVYVAITRARKAAFVLSYGEPSKYIQSLVQYSLS